MYGNLLPLRLGEEINKDRKKERKKDSNHRAKI